MSLVDYASSSDDDDEEIAEEKEENDEKVKEIDRSAPPAPDLHNQSSIGTLHQQSDRCSQSSRPYIEKLPDASELLNSTVFSSHQMIGGDHSSRVAAAMAKSASRKRESNGTGSSVPRKKHPRGNLPQSRISLDTVGGLLLPPQLNGRSNVVTEDIGKLFVSKHDL